MENLLTGMILVLARVWLFLVVGARRLITALNLPLALLFAFSGNGGQCTAANRFPSARWIFGIVWISTVIMMEGIFRSFAHKGGSAYERVVAVATESAGPCCPRP